MAKLPFRRRRVLVDRTFQRSLCLHGLVLVSFVLVVVTLGIFLPLVWQLGSARSGQDVSADSATVMLYMHERFWGIALFSFVFVVARILQVSHRIAGPLVRFKRNLRLIAAGSLPPPLRTRRRDYLKEEVLCLNEAVAGVRDRLEGIRAAHARLQRELVAVVDRQAATERSQFQPLVAAQRDLANALQAFTEAGELDAIPAAVGDEGGVVLAFAGRSGPGGS